MRTSGLEMRGDRKREPHVHAARVALHRRVDELLDASELDNFVELARDLALAHPEDRTVEVDVFTPCQLRVEARADLEQAAEPTAHVGVAGGGLGDPGEDAQESGLAGAVLADDPDDLTLVDVERHIAHRPEGVAFLPRAPAPDHFPPEPGELLTQRVVATLELPDAILLSDPDG